MRSRRVLKLSTKIFLVLCYRVMIARFLCLQLARTTRCRKYCAKFEFVGPVPSFTPFGAARASHARPTRKFNLESFTTMWKTLPPHLREISFNLHGPGWTPKAITGLGNVLQEYHDVFSNSPADFGSCSLFPFKFTVPPGSAPVTSRPYRVNPIVAKQVDAVLDQYLAAGLVQHSTSPYSKSLGYYSQEIWWCTHHR